MAEVYFYKLSLQTAAFRNRIASKCPICGNWCHLAHGVINENIFPWCVRCARERHPREDCLRELPILRGNDNQEEGKKPKKTHS